MTDEEIAKKMFEFSDQSHLHAFGLSRGKWEDLSVVQQQQWWDIGVNRQILIDCPDVDTFIPKYFDLWHLHYVSNAKSAPNNKYYSKLWELIHTYNWDDTGTTVMAAPTGELSPSIYKLKSSNIKFTIMGYLKRDEVDVVVIKYKHDGSVAEILKNEFEAVAVKL